MGCGFYSNTNNVILEYLCGNVQVEVTRFEDLEETHAEVKLKQTLWESQKEWAQDYDTWNTVSDLLSLFIYHISHG